MKQNFIISSICFIATILSSNLQATQLVQGPSEEAGFTFDNIITHKVYSRAAARLYVGLEEPQNNASIWAAARPIGIETPIFGPVAGSAGINLLTLATNSGNAMPYVVSSETTAKTAVHAYAYTGAPKGTITELNDAAGQPISNILDLAGMLLPDEDHTGFIFAAVAPTGSANFGQPESGIAVVCLNDDPSAAAISLHQAAANIAFPNEPRAKKLDPTTAEVRINADPTIDSFATMHWDEKLQRLYTGLQLTTAAGVDNGAKAVAVASVADCGVLTLHNILQEQALIAGNQEAIVAAKNGDENSIALSMLHIRTMHCSTGASYLIVNGGIGTSDQVGNVLYALPLVDICPESNIQGTIADKNARLSYKNTFTVPAANPYQLPLTSDIATQIGSGPLPIQPDTAISDIEVIGDTVYVSILTSQSQTEDNGILYSQALFDKSGKIARWTPWTKRAFPFNAFCEASCLNKGIRFFAVDAVTGKVWAVDGTTQKIVRVTAWDKGGQCSTRASACAPSSSPCCTRGSCCNNCQQCHSPYISTTACCTLAAQINASLPCGCYSVLDLDQSTRGFTAEAEDIPATKNRFALFGGCGKVDFARVSQAYNETITSPQQVFDDFCSTNTCRELNFIETVFPDADRNICINVLEYSRPNDQYPEQCYFFAGTDKGFYLFSDSGRGFSLNNLDLTTLSRGTWRLVDRPEFKEPIIDIKTTGLSLYIVTRSVKESTMASKVFRVDFKDTQEEMFSDDNIFLIAQSGIAPFEHAPAFTGIQPVTVSTLGMPETIAAEQLLMATNHGLYGSNAVTTAGNKGIASAENQDQAQWALAPKGNKIMFEGISGIDTPIPSTVWPISVEDLCGAGTYEHSWIYQMSSKAVNTLDEPFFNKFAPQFFNAIDRTQAFENIDPITYFWSDGARRFFIINRKQDTATRNKLMSFPFNTVQWRVCAPGQQVLLFDPYVVATQRFFWVKQIGVTGILMAGTESGVIALE